MALAIAGSERGAGAVPCPKEMISEACRGTWWIGIKKEKAIDAACPVPPGDDWITKHLFGMGAEPLEPAQIFQIPKGLRGYCAYQWSPTAMALLGETLATTGEFGTPQVSETAPFVEQQHKPDLKVDWPRWNVSLDQLEEDCLGVGIAAAANGVIAGVFVGDIWGNVRDWLEQRVPPLDNNPCPECGGRPGSGPGAFLIELDPSFTIDGMNPADVSFKDVRLLVGQDVTDRDMEDNPNDTQQTISYRLPDSLSPGDRLVVCGIDPKPYESVALSMTINGLERVAFAPVLMHPEEEASAGFVDEFCHWGLPAIVRTFVINIIEDLIDIFAAPCKPMPAPPDQP